MNDRRCHHRFAIGRRSQIVPAALFKMLKMRGQAGQTTNLRAGCEIYASGWHHKSRAGNEKRRRRDIRLRIEMVAGRHCNPFNLKGMTAYDTIQIIYIHVITFHIAPTIKDMTKICIKFV